MGWAGRLVLAWALGTVSRHVHWLILIEMCPYIFSLLRCGRRLGAAEGLVAGLAEEHGLHELHVVGTELVPEEGTAREGRSDTSWAL